MVHRTEASWLGDRVAATKWVKVLQQHSQPAGGGREKNNQTSRGSWDRTRFQQTGKVAASLSVRLASRKWVGAVRTQGAGGKHGMSSGEKKPSPASSGDWLGDVLLPGRPVNVPDHTLHHPLDALVHTVPAEKQ